MATPAEVQCARSLRSPRERGESKKFNVRQSFIFLLSFLSLLAADSKIKATHAISPLPGTWVLRTKPPQRLPAGAPVSTRVNHLNLYCGERGPSSVMTGGRYEGAAFLKRCRLGQQVCSWRTGCCAAVMKAKQKTELMER